MLTVNRQKILRILKKTIGIVLLVCFLCLDTFDRKEYVKKDYYKETTELLSTWEPTPEKSSPLKAGWAVENIVPPFDVNVIGYQKNDPYEGVHDSLVVRTVVFEQDTMSVAIVSFDLMIVHPLVKKAVWRELKRDSVELDAIYFTCTHTHNGFGGFAPGIAAKFALGGYRADVVNWLGRQGASAISKAMKAPKEVQLSSLKIDEGHLVMNRMDRDNGTIDPWLRVLKLETADGESALISSFAAHPTILDREKLKLSGDYPGEYNRQIEVQGLADFSMFCAGGVGSHKPVVPENDHCSMVAYASALVDSVARALPSADSIGSTMLDFAELPVEMRSPHFKVTSSFRLRPWLFYMIVGKMHPYLTYMRVGDMVFLGAPCDFSGELIDDIEGGIQNQELDVMVTSFNGEYIGYITEDKYYDWDRFEARDMNWFGPYNGAYFSGLMSEMVNKKAPSKN